MMVRKNLLRYYVKRNDEEYMQGVNISDTSNYLDLAMLTYSAISSLQREEGKDPTWIEPAALFCTIHFSRRL
jgi:hypothetical protein